MAASTTNLQTTNSSNANFRTWVGTVIAAVLAGGWVQTTDSGQIDPVTVNAPGASSTVMGYAIFRSNDGGGGLNEFYVKLTFGSGAATNNPQIVATCGWGSDGSGNLTGNVSTALNVTVGAGAALDWNFASGVGYLCLGMAFTGTASSGIVTFERVRNAAGAVTDAVFMWGWTSSGPTRLHQTIPRTGGVSINGNTLGYGVLFTSPAAASYGGSFGTSLVFPQLGSFFPPVLNIMAADTTNFSAAGMTHTMNAYGSNHTYIVGANTNGIQNNYRMMMRYE